MRGLILTSSIVLMLSFASGFADAGPRVIQVDPAAATEVPPGFETYRGYIYDLSENVDRKDKGAIVDLLKKQLDVVESVGLSPKVLQFFHTVPIVASEMGCTEIGPAIACYGSPPDTPARDRSFTVWDSNTMSWSNPNFVDLAADAGPGVIKLRPNMLKYAEDPIILHELLHAYHAKLMYGGLNNVAIKAVYAMAVSKNIFPKEEYAMKNPQEFFAVTASVFLANKESLHEPHTRARLKEKMPKYYKFLVELFGFDPDPSTTPVADGAKPADTAAMSPADGT